MTEIREGAIVIKANPEPGEGRWNKDFMPSQRIETPIDLTVVPAVSSLQRDAVRAKLIAMLQQVDVADAIGASVAFLLGCVDTHPYVLRKILSAEVTRGSVRCRIVDVLNRGVR